VRADRVKAFPYVAVRNKGWRGANIARSPDGTGRCPPYVVDIAKTNDRDDANERETPMTAEITILTAAHDHQAELLAEADARRLLRRTHAPISESQPATRQRLNTLLRRLAGTTSFA
jgi:hypothetical protein